MKKNILVISLIVTFIIGSFSAAFITLLPQRDNVSFSETVLFGDPKAAEGLTLEYKNRYDYHLFWDTTWTIGTPAESAETHYTFSQTENRPDHETVPGIDLKTFGFLTYYLKGVPSGMQKAYEELIASAKPGEDNRRTIHLADYYDYYPVSGIIEFPSGMTISWNERSLTDESSDSTTAKAFQEFFKIPVLEEDTIEISVTLDSNGQASSTRSSYGSDTLYYMETESVVTEEACYFTIQTAASSGKTVDTSLIPGGYGIYRLPLNMENNTIRVDELSMVYSLKPGIVISTMKLNSDSTGLYLFTSEDDGCYFTEIRLSDMRTLQRLRINDASDIFGYMIHTADDYFAFYGSDSNDVSGYRVFSRDGSGQFKFDFLIPSPIDEGRDYFNFYSDGTFAYDGERAALTGLAVSTSQWSSAFTLAVYDETGMLYCGEYNTGQNCRERSQGSRSYNCVPAVNQMAEISWN